MAVADRVAECVKNYNAEDLENALIQVCIASDATAKREYPRVKEVGRRFRAFIKANQDIITYFAFNTNVFIDCQFGEYTIEQFIYKVLRCGLLHEGDLSRKFKFAEPGAPISIGDEQWCLPKTFIFGALLAIIGAQSNSGQVLAGDPRVSIMGKSFRVNELWGRADLIRSAIGPPVAAE